MYRKFLLYLITCALCVGITACGGGHKKAAPTSVCQHNRSYVGCAVPAESQPRTKSRSLAPVSGAEFPDVSVWQKTVSWASVAAWQKSHGWKPYGIFKMGEFTLDSQAVRNSSETQRLGIGRAGYWFVRNTGCAHEASLILWAAQRFNLRTVVLDVEVPEAKGYVACLAPPLQRAGHTVVIYTAPGTWPGGSTNGLDEWVASYGPRHAPCFVTCHVGPGTHPTIVAWQFTDGRFGFPTSIPGLGSIDMSVDYGIESGGHVPPPPLPVCYHHRISKAQCTAAKSKVAGYQRAVMVSQKVYNLRSCQVFAQRINWFSGVIRSQPHSPKLAGRKRALTASQKVYKARHCSVFASRVGFYSSLIKQTEAAN